MKKRIAILVVVLLMCVTLAAPNLALAAKKNTELAAITLRVPYFPNLEISMKNVPYLCGVKEMGPYAKQVKFYYTKKTEICLSEDITFAGLAPGMKTVKYKAGKFMRAADYPTGTLGVVIIVSRDGSYKFTNDTNITINDGQKVYFLDFIEVSRYSANVDKEDYTAVDITKWEVETSKEADESDDEQEKTTAKTKQINVSYGSSGKTSFSYTISGVTKTEQIRIADSSTLKKGGETDASLLAMAGKKMNVYTVQAGQKIFIDGAIDCYFTPMKIENKKLVGLYPNGRGAPTNWSKIFKLNASRGDSINIGNGYSFRTYANGSYAQFLTEGYYMFAALPFVPQHYQIDPSKSNFGECYEKPTYKYGGVILHVVK